MALQVTPEKLDEFKDAIPKAGPKFRLGMYFDTIHEIPEFDAIIEPEEGYRSCWDTDTDIECCDEGFLFADVDGDSASLICLNDEEAMDIISRWKSRHEPHGKTSFEDMTCHKKSTCKQLPTTKPGSECTYENIDGEGNPEDHIYESIDDCVAEYQLFLSNASNGSGDSHDSPTNTPTHRTAKAVTNQVGVRHSKRTRRVNSLPVPHEPLYTSSRKLSDCTEYAHLHRHQGSASLHPTTHSTDGTPSSEYSALPRLSEKLNPADGKKKDASKPTTIMLKHKGKSYVLPITESKKSKKHPSPKHTSGLKGSPSTATQLGALAMSSMAQSMSVPVLQHQGPPLPRRQNSPPKCDAKEQANSQRRKSKQHLSQQPTNPKLLTLYGVI